MNVLKVQLPGRNAAWMDAYLQENCTELEMTRWEKRPAVLIVPGGAYMFVAQREGEPFALRYAAAGFQTFVLHYSINVPFEQALLDIAAAMREIRSRAAQWHIDSKQVAVLGASAGGNLALWLAAKSRPGETMLAKSEEEAGRIRPNAMVLCYPTVTGTGCAKTFVRTLPSKPLCEQVRGMPPTFLWATQEDETVPVSETFALAEHMNREGVPLEMHIYQRGGHGLATADAATGRVNTHVAGWLQLSIDWLYEQFGL